jgi:hypothetical protein
MLITSKHQLDGFDEAVVAELSITSIRITEKRVSTSAEAERRHKFS